MEKFTSKNIQELKPHSFSHEKVEQQLETFKTGIPFVKLVAPATLGGGICKLSKKEIKKYAEKYEAQNVDVVKFVPASGAATRMFKNLQNFVTEGLGKAAAKIQGDETGKRHDKTVKGRKGDEYFENELKKQEHKSVRKFFDQLPDFPFYKKLLSETKTHYPDFTTFSETKKKHSFLKTLLDSDKLNFPNLPKGLIPFHKYANETRSAFEEHFIEAEKLGTPKNPLRLHFTVSEGHVEKFQNSVPSWFLYKNRLSFSHQEKKTDTIAVDMENKPFRDENGKLVFRPAGHGALLENLNAIDADLIFIKNIDNVSTEKNLPIIAEHKKALAGILLELQAETFNHLKALNLYGSKNLMGPAKKFLREKLNVKTNPQNLSEIKTLLDRPIRVCGMVRNTGAPGGGPFWVQEKDGEISLQIVETAQIDIENPQQKEILENATHFNPVDLVCGVKNYKAEKIDLIEFSNPKRGFITKKSMNGRDLKALELPGLWNGAMEHWNTVFVEVPQETFNPVKTVMDLLKPGHQ